MADGPITLFLAGDVITGRGVDQILTSPSRPELHEPFVADAREYVRLAGSASGPVPRGVAPEYVWGDALAEWKRVAPADRIVNPETSITRSTDYDAAKDIHYRRHPDNTDRLAAARFDVCALANNHVLDYGREGFWRRCGHWTVGASALWAPGGERDQRSVRHPRDGDRTGRAALAQESRRAEATLATGNLPHTPRESPHTGVTGAKRARAKPSGVSFATAMPAHRNVPRDQQLNSGDN